MVEPTTVNKVLTVPNTGDLSGAWGTAALNPNWTAVDGILGGFVAISLSTGATTLSVPSGGVASPGAGPTQSQNALIRFSGTLTGNCTVVFTLPGFYIVENTCSGNGSFYIQLVPSGGGHNIGAPPGQKQYVFYDGTNMDYVDLPPVGTFLDLAVSSVPLWMNACTVAPWLPCIGQAFSTTTYANLNSLIGNTFGGTVSTPLLPDHQGRYRAAIDGTGARLTSGISGVNGSVLGAAGGDQNLLSHSHPVPGDYVAFTGGAGTLGGTGFSSAAHAGTLTSTTGTTGAGASGNVPPVFIGMTSFIKT
jgi:microcystin-dependent protein